MSQRFEDSVNEALDRLGSVNPATVEAVRTSIRALPDRSGAEGLVIAALRSPRFRSTAFALVAILITTGFIAALVPLWRASTGPGVRSPSRGTSVLAASPSGGHTEGPRFADPGGPVFDMQRVTASSGWALLMPPEGGQGDWPSKLVITDDAGMSWRDATPPGIRVASIDFVDPDHGWVLQSLPVDPDHLGAPVDSALWRTSDGGRRWEKEALPAQAIFAAAISFVGPDNGYLVLVPDAGPDYRRTLVYSTTNGAHTWTEVGRISGDLQIGSAPARPLVALTGNDALLVRDGPRGGALQTHDGGRTWNAIGLPTPAEIPFSSGVDIRQLVRAGGDLLASAQYFWKTGASYTFAPGYEFVSHDRGRTWTLAWTGSHDLSQRDRILAVDETTVFQFPDYAAMIPDVYDKTFSVSHDAGQTWTSVSPLLPADAHFDIESFGDSLNGWAAISQDAHCLAGMSCPYTGGLPGALVTTNDGGRTWATGTSR